MHVLVYPDGSNVVIEVGKEKIVLTEPQGKLVLKKLAEIYGFRVLPTKPDIRVVYEPVSQNIKIYIFEGKGVRDIVVPLKVVVTYLQVLKRLGPGRHSKRELAELVMNELVKDPEISKKLEKYFVGGVFDWEKFFGGRSEYYELFRAPLLLLDKLDVVEEKQGTHITVTDRVADVDENELTSYLRSYSSEKAEPKRSVKHSRE